MDVFEAVDIVILMLASALAAIVLMAAYSHAIRDTDISPTKEKILTFLLSGLLSAISMFIGARLEPEDPCCKLLAGRGHIQLQPPVQAPPELKQALEWQQETSAALDEVHELLKALKDEEQAPMMDPKGMVEKLRDKGGP